MLIKVTILMLSKITFLIIIDCLDDSDYALTTFVILLVHSSTDIFN